MIWRGGERSSTWAVCVRRRCVSLPIPRRWLVPCLKICGTRSGVPYGPSAQQMPTATNAIFPGSGQALYGVDKSCRAWPDGTVIFAHDPAGVAARHRLQQAWKAWWKTVSSCGQRCNFGGMVGHGYGCCWREGQGCVFRGVLGCCLRCTRPVGRCGRSGLHIFVGGGPSPEHASTPSVIHCGDPLG